MRPAKKKLTLKGILSPRQLKHFHVNFKRYQPQAARWFTSSKSEE